MFDNLIEIKIMKINKCFDHVNSYYFCTITEAKKESCVLHVKLMFCTEKCESRLLLLLLRIKG